MDKRYIQFLTDLKQNIIQSRYIAARLANKEQLLLYFRIGKMLSEKIAAEKWGTKIIEQLADDLQHQLPGLRGFSYRSLMKMKQLADGYSSFSILPSLTAELKTKSGKYSATSRTSQSLPSEIPEIKEKFFGISFSHHMILLNKCKRNDERIFYMTQAADQFWSVSILEHHIEANLYSHQGKLPNNFTKTLPEQLKPSALQVFQDEYLMDFISPAGSDNERIFEEKIVADN